MPCGQYLTGALSQETSCSEEGQQKMPTRFSAGHTTPTGPEITPRPPSFSPRRPSSLTTQAPGRSSRKFDDDRRRVHRARRSIRGSKNTHHSEHRQRCFAQPGSRPGPASPSVGKCAIAGCRGAHRKGDSLKSAQTHRRANDASCKLRGPSATCQANRPPGQKVPLRPPDRDRAFHAADVLFRELESARNRPRSTTPSKFQSRDPNLGTASLAQFLSMMPPLYNGASCNRRFLDELFVIACGR